MKKYYIKAVVELLLQCKDVDVVLANLKKTLTYKGHLSIHLHILQGVLIELAKSQNESSSTLCIANKRDLQKYKDAIEASLVTLGGDTKNAQVSIDETLIGGYVASHNGKLINKSHKQKLVALYRSITT